MKQQQGMESIIFCPMCGEQLLVVMTAYQAMLSGLMKAIEGSIGVGINDHFEGVSKCKCGRNVRATLHITAEPRS